VPGLPSSLSISYISLINSLAFPSDWAEHVTDSDFVEQRNPNPSTPSGATTANDDYDIYSFDEGEDYFEDNSTPHPLETQRIDPSASLEPISSSAIRLVQQSISRIKSSASSSGLFGTSSVLEEKNNAMETKGHLPFPPPSSILSHEL
jgi:hypothetical protein